MTARAAPFELSDATDRTLSVSPLRGASGLVRVAITWPNGIHRSATASVVVDLDHLLCDLVRMAQTELGSDEVDAAARALRCES